MDVDWHDLSPLRFLDVGKRKRRVRKTNKKWRQAACEPLEPRQLLAADLVISEVMASNAASLLDEDRDTSDWIEVHNQTATTVDLSGWTLSDDARQLNKWSFPSVSIEAGDFLIVFASGKDRRVGGENLHTNFKLSKSGEYLGLGRPDGTVAHDFAPSYPAQQTDVSYGVAVDNNATLGFMPSSTPGAANEQVFVGFASEASISVAGGIFEEAFQVRIATDMTDAVIRYTTDGSDPSQTNGEPYSGPITIDGTTTLRARATKPNYVPGPIDTSTYLFLDNVLQQTRRCHRKGA